jgi:N-acetylmuramoyl-L-alanine amidase
MKRLTILFMVLGFLLMVPTTTMTLLNHHHHIAKPMKFSHHIAKPMKFSEADYYWMAKNVYHEAGNQSGAGLLAVMKVTMNRVADKNYPSTIKEVVTQKNSRGCQFSWYCMKRVPYDEQHFMRTYNYVKAVLPFLHVIDDATHGAVYYHATYVKPYWAKVKVKTVKIGDHIFYRENVAK